MEKEKITAKDIENLLIEERDDKQRNNLMRFFKTGKGEYGEGDSFLGLKVPQTRAIVKEAKLRIDMQEIEHLLYSKWHEVRLSALLLLVEEMKSNLPKRKDSEETLKIKFTRRKEIATFYLRHARQANNWDLVDLSCEYVLGVYLRLSDKEDYEILYSLAKSENLWEQRIAIVTTLEFIRNGIFNPTLQISDLLLNHHHDLIHKAIGWMLREIGKRDKDILLDYLERNFARMPRTTLRYAIEKFPAPERQHWLNRKRIN
ncbi:MAG: DNA alkylation repair protein [Muribaculaceae bacterium]|nr:DNA alkylation repair protein [Muribaculaceae bacterium]